MAQHSINIGTTANDGTGDTLRVAFGFINTDFGEVYSTLGTLTTAIAAKPALGETSTDAYRGDRGKTAYDFSQTATTVGAAFVALTNPGAITFLRVNADNSVTALSASAFRTAIGAGTSNFDGAYSSLTGAPAAFSPASPGAIGGTTPAAGTFLTLIARQSGGVAGTDEVQVSHDGADGTVQSKDGAIRLLDAENVGMRIRKNGGTIEITPIGGGRLYFSDLATQIGGWSSSPTDGSWGVFTNSYPLKWPGARLRPSATDELRVWDSTGTATGVARHKFPSADPHVAGEYWDNGTSLSRSAG